MRLFGLAACLPDQVIRYLQRALQRLGLGAGGEVTAVDAQGRDAVHRIGVLQLRGLARFGADREGVEQLDKLRFGNALLFNPGGDLVGRFLAQASNIGSKALQCGQLYQKNSTTSIWPAGASTGAGLSSVR